MCKGTEICSKSISGDDSALIACNSSGYMRKDLFRQWFDHFLKWVRTKHNDPILFIIDNCAAHEMDADFYNKAKALNVEILALPPNPTHVLQAVRYGCFSVI
ncbi:hypothetical protein [Pedobacter sp.]|uniref:hypothetical protein n=1 Tax=Pedobacter sp. TaxID=1411316 RepID=UPI003D7F1CED